MITPILRPIRSSPDLPKERFEVCCDGRSARCDNFRSTHSSDAKNLETFNQDKGHGTVIEKAIDARRQGRSSPSTVSEITGVSMATFVMLESARTGREIRLGRLAR
ncbi:hypothetical protein KJ059_11590 [Myxococcota bacterium]|nr:hypothetical protein [Myxococcota bacterium]